MIISESTLHVVDNSGALIAKCFRIFGSNTGKLGSMLVISVKTFRSGKKVKKGEVYKAVLVSTKTKYRRNTGSYIKYIKNGVVLWKRKEDSPIGTRVTITVPVELRFKGFLKIILLSLGTF